MLSCLKKTDTPAPVVPAPTGNYEASLVATGVTSGSSSFSYPKAIAIDKLGNSYVSSTYNASVYKITPEGVVTLFAGTPDLSPGTFNNPSGLAVDNDGNVYVADNGNHRICKITPEGVVSTFAGSATSGNTNGTGTGATFAYPVGLALDATGNLYVSDTENENIRKITPAGVVTTLTSLTYPTGVAVDKSGNLYIAQPNLNRIAKLTPSGTLSTLAGNGSRGFPNGVGVAAYFNNPNGVAVDTLGNVYVADTDNGQLRRIDASGVVSTFTGSGNRGYFETANIFHQFMSYPFSLAVDANGNIYLADTSENRVLKLTD